MALLVQTGGFAPLRFGFASLAHIATYLSIGLIAKIFCGQEILAR
jgi:hypothetical protein